MKIRCFFHLLINFLVASIAYGQNSEKGFASIIGTSFPSDFLFGSSSSAYQYEGGAAEGGRQPSIWDTFAKQHPDKVLDHSNGNIATDSYHRYKEDVAIMKDIGFSAYRFSISWSRVLPSGKLRGGVNQEGIDYYNNLINELLLQGIKPFVTLFHFDLPQALEDEYSGFLNISIVDDFRDYAELCFSKFGDRVKNWITLNEPLQFSSLGYSSPMFAPTRCSNRLVCSQGDSGTEPYIVGHNQLLAHAAAVKVYREKFQKLQNGQIGIALNSAWFLPYSESIKDRDAASRALAFQYDWFMEPLKSGSYPVEMVTHVGTRLPQFTPEQSSFVKGSFDFIGLNYYTSQYAMDVPCKTENFTYQSDFCANLTSERNGTPIGFKVSVWLYVYAPGLYELLLYSKNKFNDPVIYITENGVSEQDTGTVSLKDNIRVDYIDSHLSSVQKAMMNGVKVKGYLAWSLLDNWEWVAGFTARFGMVYVDFKNGLKRLPKLSAMKFKEFLQTRNQTQTGNTTKSQPRNDNVKVDL